MSTLASPALSRRRFLAAASSLAASQVLSPLVFGAGRASAAAPDGEILSCSNFGAFWAKVQDGRVIGVRPWEGDPHPIPTIEGAVDLAYSASRIRYPMVRRAWLEKGPGADPETRGRDDFVRVSWDKALELVAGEIKRCAALGLRMDMRPTVAPTGAQRPTPSSSTAPSARRGRPMSSSRSGRGRSTPAPTAGATSAVCSTRRPRCAG